MIIISYEDKKKFIVNVTFFAVAAAITVFVVKYVIGWIMPFIMAFAVAAILQPLAKKVSKYLKAGRKASALFCTTLFYVTAVAILALAGFGIYSALKNWLTDLPQIYNDNIVPAMSEILRWLQNTLDSFNPELAISVNQFADQFFANFGSFVSDISGSAIGYLSSWVTKVPFFVVGVLISVIATFFISLDFENITAFIKRQIPQKWQPVLGDIRVYGLSTLGKYGKSYLLIMSITFCELCIALWLLGVENFAIIALATAVFDIIPVCGSGGVLIPWSVISLVQGRFAFGIGMLVVYAIITIIRQIIEPKIVGDQVGLHPVVTLMAMFLGARFIGVFGLFAFPITLVILKQLNNDGKIHLFK
ncbi:MAG: sporulation integral membrane protein YtvI [Oscillospiraceae bacterium]|nr:sporulation integral membrane protein YtvI [Oscillospiraceae bacterium]